MKSYLFKSIGISLIVALTGIDLYLSIGQWSVAETEVEATTEPSPSSTESPTTTVTDRSERWDETDFTGPEELGDLGIYTIPSDSNDRVSYFRAASATTGKFANLPVVMSAYYVDGPGEVVPAFFVETSPGTYTAINDFELAEDTETGYSSKVTNTIVDSSLPLSYELSLDANTVLTRTSFPIDYYDSEFTEPKGYSKDATQYVLKDRTLLKKVGGLTFYSDHPPLSFDYVEATYSTHANSIREMIKAGFDHIGMGNGILAVDSVGAAALYTLGTKDDKTKVFAETTSDTIPRVPSYRVFKSQISDLSVSLMSDDYQPYSDSPCSISGDSATLSKVTEDDLSKIGSTSNGDLYILKDKNHPLYTIIYENLVLRSYENMLALNKTDSNNEYLKEEVPTFAKYVSSNPILIRKDYFNRYIMLEEHYYLGADGCGKPVIYLYAEEPTNVSVEFQAPVNLRTQIPTYSSGWFVEASPSGQLKDLQPQFTNCSLLPVKKGTEYAKEACATGTYPYLYWSGSVTSIAYPKEQNGWIVQQSEVESSLAARLTEMGLNSTEKRDMLEYWVPALLSKDAPYYRLSFFQTDTVNAMFPMKVTPNPDTTFRIFLDWEPLSKPITIKPQSLQTLTRKGFTLVEWGGLKR